MKAIIDIPDPQISLTKEPYSQFQKQFKRIRDIDGEEIELDLSTAKEGFYKGFFIDKIFSWAPRLRFAFARMNPNSETDITAIYILMTYSFELNKENFFYYQSRVRTMKHRVEYYYIPFVSHLAVSFDAQIDDNRFKLHYKVIVPQEEHVLDVCYCLINQLITLFSFED